MIQFKTVFLAATIALLAISCADGKKAQLPKEQVAKEQKPQSKVEKETEAKIEPKTDSKPLEKKEAAQYRLLGQVSSQEKILLSFKQQGNIQRLLVKPGTRVKKGQLVAELDSFPFELRETTAKLQLEKATNLRAQAERDYKIEQELRGKDISSVEQFQNAELGFKNSEVAQQLAEVDLKTAQKALADSRLVAPVDGTISRQIKFVGDPSGTGDGATFEMYPAVDPEIYLNAPESLLAKVALGANVEVNFSALGLKLAGKIVRIVPIIRESDRTFVVVAKLLKSDPRIVPGLFVEAQLKIDGK